MWSSSYYHRNPVAGSSIFTSQWYSVSITGEQVGNPGTFCITAIDLPEKWGVLTDQNTNCTLLLLDKISQSNTVSYVPKS